MAVTRTGGGRIVFLRFSVIHAGSPNPNARKAGAALIAEFEAALQRVTSQRRARMLLNIADLFVAVSDRIGDTEIAMFDNLLLGQFGITDHATLVTLSQRLSTVANAPPNLIEKFASNASAAIAGPVLSHSARLFTPDLVRYAAMHGQDHLHAICAREEIPEPLSAICSSAAASRSLTGWR